MTVETDALADAALRFSEAIKAERANTLDALATERQAALTLLRTLRTESQRRGRQAGARFVIGFLIGSALGAAAIYVINQRTSEEARLGLAANVDSAGTSVTDRIKAAIETGRRAAASREQELWNEYRKRLTEPPPPRAEPLF